MEGKQIESKFWQRKLEDILCFFQANRHLAFAFFARDDAHDVAADGFGPSEVTARRLMTTLWRPVPAIGCDRNCDERKRDRLAWTRRGVRARVRALQDWPGMEFAIAWRLEDQLKVRLVHSSTLLREEAFAELVDIVQFHTGHL